MGAFIWSHFTRVSQEKYFYIAEPAYLNLEQNDAFFPVSKEKLPENIKSLTKKYYVKELSESNQDFGTDEQLFQKDVFSYDRDKHLLKRIVYRDNKLHSEWTFKYNSDGKRIADETGVPLLSRTIYNYNEKGNMVGWNNYNNEGGLISSAILKYDDKNNLVEEFRQNASGKGREKYIYNYNSTGQKMSILGYLSTDYLYKTYAYIYNDQGKLMEWLIMYRNGYVDEREVYSYDSNGNLNEKISYLSGRYLVGKTTCHYDDKGNKKEEFRFFSKPDAPSWRTSYKYDNEEKLIEQSGYSIWVDPVSKTERISASDRSVFEYEFYPK